MTWSGAQLVEEKGGKQQALIQVKYGEARVLRSEQHTQVNSTHNLAARKQGKKALINKYGVLCRRLARGQSAAREVVLHLPSIYLPGIIRATLI